MLTWARALERIDALEQRVDALERGDGVVEYLDLERIFARLLYLEIELRRHGLTLNCVLCVLGFFSFLTFSLLFFVPNIFVFYF